MSDQVTDYSGSKGESVPYRPARGTRDARTDRLKVVIDLSVATLAIVFLLPLLAFIALAIRLDSPGPILFRQKRNGIDKHVFSILKFRTMSVLEDGDTCKQAVRGDARVTRVGKFLRRTSTDELPQLFNVLRRDMSLVGPRPHPVGLDARFETSVDNYSERFSVLPGITGLAQINGCRGPTEAPGSMSRRLSYDLEYIRNWSPWLDVKIIVLTPFKGIAHNNAY